MTDALSHEQWSYQAMVHELIGIHDNTVKLTSGKVRSAGGAGRVPAGTKRKATAQGPSLQEQARWSRPHPDHGCVVSASSCRWRSSSAMWCSIRVRMTSCGDTSTAPMARCAGGLRGGDKACHGTIAIPQDHALRLARSGRGQ